MAGEGKSRALKAERWFQRLNAARARSGSRKKSLLKYYHKIIFGPSVSQVDGEAINPSDEEQLEGHAKPEISRAIAARSGLLIIDTFYRGVYVRGKDHYKKQYQKPCRQVLNRRY